MKKIEVTDINIKQAAMGAYMDYIKYTQKWKREASMSNFFVGYVGEAAYHQYIGKEFVYKHYKNSGDGGVDVDDVQVKTTTVEGSLIITSKDKCFKNTKVSRIVLAYFNKNKAGKEVRIVGEISKKNFLEKSLSYAFTNKKGERETKYTLREDQLDIFYK